MNPESLRSKSSKAPDLKSPPLHPSAQLWSGFGCQSFFFVCLFFGALLLLHTIYYFVFHIFCLSTAVDSTTIFILCHFVECVWHKQANIPFKGQHVYSNIDSFSIIYVEASVFILIMCAVTLDRRLSWWERWMSPPVGNTPDSLNIPLHYPSPRTQMLRHSLTDAHIGTHRHTQAFAGKLPLHSFALVPVDYIWLILIKQPISQ